jgi:hypothetical protein
MDWQQWTALLIVGVTACIFALRLARPRKFTWKRETKCGCSSAGDLNAKQTLRFSARKGARPQIIVKNT